MKYLSLLLVSLLICNSYSLGYVFELVGPVSLTAINCLYNNPDIPVSSIIIRIYKISGTRGVDQGGVQTLLLQPQSPIIIYTYVQICRGDDPNTVANALIQAYPGKIYLIGVYVKVHQNTISGCTWRGYTHQQNCDYLTAVMNSLFSSNLIYLLRIFSTRPTWNSFFGDTCNSLADTYDAIWYANYDTRGRVNTDLTNADFKPFGGWTTGTVKTASNSLHITLCDNPNGMFGVTQSQEHFDRYTPINLISHYYNFQVFNNILTRPIIDCIYLNVLRPLFADKNQIQSSKIIFCQVVNSGLMIFFFFLNSLIKNIKTYNRLTLKTVQKQLQY